jgi:hypothetical protein
MFGHQNDQQYDANQNSDQIVNDVTPPAPSPAFTPPPPAPSLPGPSFTPAVPDANDAADTPTPPPSDSPAPVGTNDLLDIKQQALTQLSPLVGHLDQSPEEKFRTTMMMIQASDNQGLIKDAYEAAQQISDEKTKAQALLDVINEINYFTHHTES